MPRHPSDPLPPIAPTAFAGAAYLVLRSTGPWAGHRLLAVVPAVLLAWPVMPLVLAARSVARAHARPLPRGRRS